VRLAPLLLVIVLLAGCGNDDGGADPAEDPSSSASPAARHFLDTYLTDDGRVLRRDQGDDIVSEGQAYGMLIAELAGRDDLVPTIWSWSEQHLGRSDLLLSFHASEDGTVSDPEAAADADVLAAYALLVYDGPDAGRLHDDGQALAAAVLDHEVLRDGDGQPVLAAGPWAVGTGTVNPSYLMPGIFDALAQLTGEKTWSQLATSSVALVRQVTDEGRLLPPDWARLQGSSLVPAADASGTQGVGQYGPDAQRVPIWFAHACTPDARDLAAGWWSILQQDQRSNALALGTDGQVKDPSPQPLALLASAAAAEAAGDTSGAHDLTRGAAEAAQGAPSYYGDAWLALAPMSRPAAC
jgi:endo-1,4-beta-D-glucanase Y